MTANEFVCSLCLFDPSEHGDDWDDRLTVINGQLVCGEHAGYVQGEPWSRALQAMKRDHA